MCLWHVENIKSLGLSLGIKKSPTANLPWFTVEHFNSFSELGPRQQNTRLHPFQKHVLNRRNFNLLKMFRVCMIMISYLRLSFSFDAAKLRKFSQSPNKKSLSTSSLPPLCFPTSIHSSVPLQPNAQEGTNCSLGAFPDNQIYY